MIVERWSAGSNRNSWVFQHHRRTSGVVDGSVTAFGTDL